MKILVTNGRLIDPASGLDEPGDVAIAAGRIVSLGRVSADFHANRVIAARSTSPATSTRACSSPSLPRRLPAV